MSINLVQGHSAGGLLRRARQLGLPGEVRVIDDYLSLGPLQGDQTRNDWWATVYGSEEAYQPSLYAQWQSLSNELEGDAEAELVVWSSNSACDYVFERMAAFMLKDRELRSFSVVRAPSSHSLEGIPFISPHALADLVESKFALADDGRAEWSAAFARDLKQSSGIRRLEGGVLVSLPEDSLDDLLLECCPHEWTKWYFVVGDSMTACDGQNLIHDAFLSWRLTLLVAAKRVEAQGDLMSMAGRRDVLVRRLDSD